MNTPTTPTPDLESLRKAVQEFRPIPHRVPFNGLKPVHDSIVELRKQNVSYAAIAELLQQHGVKTSRARVAEYGRIVLDGGKKRKRRKWAKTTPAANIPATPQSAPAVAAKPAPAMPRRQQRHKQRPAATKRKFSIPFTRTAHRQREHNESRGSQRIRGQPETRNAPTANRMTVIVYPARRQHRHRCPARQPEAKQTGQRRSPATRSRKGSDAAPTSQ